MKDRRGRRRRSKVLWVRDSDRRTLHMVANSLWREFRQTDWSEKQEWLFDQIMVELAYRRSHEVWTARCTCWFCTPDEFANVMVHHPTLYLEEEF